MESRKVKSRTLLGVCVCVCVCVSEGEHEKLEFASENDLWLGQRSGRKCLSATNQRSRSLVPSRRRWPQLWSATVRPDTVEWVGESRRSIQQLTAPPSADDRSAPRRPWPLTDAADAAPGGASPPAGSRSCWYFFFWPSFFTMSSFQDGHSMIMKFSRYITRLEIVGGLDLMASYEANNS